MTIYSFGTFQFDCDNYQLIKPEGVETLQPRPGRLLAYLLKKRDRLVSKEELMDHIWRGTVVQDQSIFQCVNQLRRALGDLPRTPLYIRTVSKRGYQWIHPQTFVQHPEESEAVSEPFPNVDPKILTAIGFQPTEEAWRGSTEKKGHRKGVIALATTGVLACILILSVYSPRGGHPAAGATRLALLPFINETGNSELKWIELGLLGMMFGLLADERGLELVSMPRVLKARETLSLNPSHLPGSSQLGALRQRLDAEIVVHTTIKPGQGGYILSCMLYGPKEALGNFTLRGKNPAHLAEEMARVLPAKLRGVERQSMGMADDSRTELE